MSFEVLMRQCAAHEDQLQREAAELEREEAWLAAVALIEARLGDIDKVWSATDHGDNAKEVIAALLECAQSGHPAAIRAIKLLTHTFGANNAELV